MRTCVTTKTTKYADDGDESNYTESAKGATSDGDSIYFIRPAVGER